MLDVCWTLLQPLIICLDVGKGWPYDALGLQSSQLIVSTTEY
eukprot:COSAG05_NODE_26_length_29797_cov_35.911139_2_plen_42_part_00